MSHDWADAILDAVLECPMDKHDLKSDTLTIREYLTELLVACWREREGFDGKRPFGNSGWVCDVEMALVRAGLLDGEVYEFEPERFELVRADSDTARELVTQAILHMTGTR